MVHSYGGALYDYGEDGYLIVQKTGKQILHIPALSDSNVNSEQISNITDFFNQNQVSENAKTEIYSYAFIDINCCDIKNPQILENILDTTKKLLKDCLVYLRFHFDIPQMSWREFFQNFIKCCRDSFNEKMPVFHLCGHFALTSESDKDFLFSNCFRLYYAHDPTLEHQPFSDEDKKIVEDLAEYGFRIPFLWYVHQKNTDRIVDIIDEGMKINYNSGFAIPPVCDSFFPIAETIPLFDKYLQLLINVYEKYPYYDEVLFPLNLLLKKHLSKSLMADNYFFRMKCLSHSLEKFEINDFTMQIYKFWNKAFLWQEWKVLQTYSPPECQNVKRNE
jgi:hypothetical protein